MNKLLADTSILAAPSDWRLKSAEGCPAEWADEVGGGKAGELKGKENVFLFIIFGIGVVEAFGGSYRFGDALCLWNSFVQKGGFPCCSRAS